MNHTHQDYDVSVMGEIFFTQQQKRTGKKEELKCRALSEVSETWSGTLDIERLPGRGVAEGKAAHFCSETSSNTFTTVTAEVPEMVRSQVGIVPCCFLLQVCHLHLEILQRSLGFICFSAQLPLEKKKINQQPHEVRQQGECKGREFRIALRAKDSRAPSTHLYLKVSESWPSH